LPLDNAMMPDGDAAHRLPPFEQRRSREFKLRAKNRLPAIRKPDKNARTCVSNTNPLEYRVGMTVKMNKIKTGQTLAGRRRAVRRGA